MLMVRVRAMVFNPTFRNISVVSWRSVLLVEETRVPEETVDLSQDTDKLIQNVVIEYTSSCAGFKLTTLVVICTDCIGSCKTNCHTITTTNRPPLL